MAAKKRTKKKQKLGKRVGKKKTLIAKKAKKKSIPNKRKAPKKVAKKKAAQKAVKAKVSGRKALARTASSAKSQVPKKGKATNTAVFSSGGPGSPRSGGQSGDLQGLSRYEGADSESVEELIEEGNAFEADVVSGVEAAGDADEGEVHTHEVPEDDVPGEYLDKD